MIKSKLTEDLRQILKQLNLDDAKLEVIVAPKPELGDYSTNIALQQSNQSSDASRQSVDEIAKKILSHLSNLSYLSDFGITNGFINFFIKKELLASDLSEILEKKANFGRSEYGKGQKIQVEFVSANPTGPLTLPNGRSASIGDALARVLEFAGYLVEREYYVNDTGNQIRRLGDSIKAVGGQIPSSPDHYQGDYVKELAEKFKTNLELDSLELGHLAADYFLDNEIKPALDRMGVKFDSFFSERSLYEGGLVLSALENLKQKSLTYEKDGAVWLKSSDWGDDEDRVILTSVGVRGKSEPTYIMPDIAHYLESFKSGITKKINILGADHHSYGKRLQAALKALNLADHSQIIFIQMVTLRRGGQAVRMSKRAGDFVTLDELLDEVSPDVVRWFMLMYSPDSHINFDLDLAKQQSQKNPVFYVQYAYARMSSILDKSGELAGLGKLEQLINPAEQNLIKQLLELPELIEKLSKDYQVHHLTAYAIKLADNFHRFYETERVLNAETPELTQARVELIKASQIVLGNTLKLLGVTAPERM